MSSESLLLRMLEPAVRPGNLPGPGQARTPVAPVEQQDFESLLAQAKVTEVDERVNDTGSVTKLSMSADKVQPNPLASFGGLGGVENESLRQLLARHDRGG